MKNLKKVLALVVALTMVLGTVSFAFTDVTVDNDAYGAVTTLSSLGILNGYEDGTFGPEKDITRAEFAAVVCRALGYDSKATAATSFSDVPADHWASGYINYAAGQGIINGMGDGTFAPEKNVTYQEAVKMLVVALGYEPMAAQKGSWPTGYLVVANSNGLTKGVKSAGDAAAANRGVVAQLTYNALEIPMMEQTGYGTNVEYKVLDGNNGTSYKSLLTELEVAKLEGSVTATPIIGGGVATNEIGYTIAESNNFEDFVDYEDVEVLFEVAEGVNAADYFGIASVIYAKEYRTGKYEIVSIMPGADSAIVELDKGDIDLLSATDLKYYETATATKTTNLKLNALEDGEDFIVNNVKADLADVLALGDDAEITVIENTGDSKYDLVIAKEYTWGVIDTIEADKDRFTLKNVPGRFSFDFEDDTVSNNLVNKDGDAITLADIKEGDVVGYISEGGNKSGFTWIELICLGESKAAGVVTEANSNTNTIYVDGTEYELATGFAAPNVNDEGVYYLTKANKVFYGEIDSSVASNYAYILEIGQSTSAFSTGWQIKLLTKDNAIEIYDVKDTFTVDGTSCRKDDTTIAGLETLVGGAFAADVDKRLITYKLDANNKIREIKSVAVVSVGDATNLKEYNANAFAIDSKPLAEDVVIFNVTGTDAEDSFAAGISSLVHENEYAGYLVLNQDNEYDAFVVTEGAGAIDFTQDIAIIDSVNAITLNDDDAWKVRYYVSGEAELKEITLTADTIVEPTGALIDSTFANSLKMGDAIMFTANDQGIVSNVALVVSANNATDATSAAFAENALTVAEIDADEDLQFVKGYIKTMTTTSNGINIAYVDGANESMITVKSNANGYTYYNRTSAKVSVVAGDWMGANTIDVLDEENGEATFFFAILENGVVSDIVTYSTRKDV